MTLESVLGRPGRLRALQNLDNNEVARFPSVCVFFGMAGRMFQVNP